MTTPKKAPPKKNATFAGAIAQNVEDLTESVEDLKKTVSDHRVAVEIIEHELARDNGNFVDDVTHPAKKPCSCNGVAFDGATIFVLGVLFGTLLCAALVRARKIAWESSWMNLD